VSGEGHDPVARGDQPGHLGRDELAVEFQVQDEHVRDRPGHRLQGHQVMRDQDDLDRETGVGGDPRGDALDDHRMVLDNAGGDYLVRRASTHRL
jgi:hypothetical protein